jgi:hypothetical protein
MAQTVSQLAVYANGLGERMFYTSGGRGARSGTDATLKVAYLLRTKGDLA